MKLVSYREPKTMLENYSLNQRCRTEARVKRIKDTHLPMSGVEGTLLMLTIVVSVATDEVAGDPVAAATDDDERFKLFMASILFSMMFIFGDAVLPFAMKLAAMSAAMKLRPTPPFASPL